MLAKRPIEIVFDVPKSSFGTHNIAKRLQNKIAHPIQTIQSNRSDASLATGIVPNLQSRVKWPRQAVLQGVVPGRVTGLRTQ